MKLGHELGTNFQLWGVGDLSNSCVGVLSLVFINAKFGAEYLTKARAKHIP